VIVQRVETQVVGENDEVKVIGVKWKKDIIQKWQVEIIRRVTKEETSNGESSLTLCWFDCLGSHCLVSIVTTTYQGKS
jgi:hypothetical protein